MWQNDESDYTIKPRFQRETSDAFRLLNCARVTPLHPISQLRSAYTACGALCHGSTIFSCQCPKALYLLLIPAFRPYIFAYKTIARVNQQMPPITFVVPCIRHQSAK